MKNNKQLKKNNFRSLKWIGIVGAVCFVLFGINFAMNLNIKTSTYVISSERIAEQIDGFTIVQLSDIHSIRSDRTAENIVSKVEKEKPHIIVITGDLIDFTYYNQLREGLIKDGNRDRNVDIKTVEFVSELMRIAQVYYVFGNHERTFLNDLDNGAFIASLKDEGVILLNNEQTTITYQEQEINVLGISDPTTVYKDERYAGLGSGEEVMNAMLSDVTECIDHDLYTVLLSHRPEYFELYKHYPVDLVLTGHAHGGQIRIPFIGGLFAPNQGFFPKYTSGSFESGALNMIVNRGIGNSAFPLRVFNPPELITIKLTSSTK